MHINRKNGTFQPSRTSPDESKFAGRLSMRTVRSISFIHETQTGMALSSELHWFLSYYNEVDRCYFFPRQPGQVMWAQMVIFSCSLQSGHIEPGLCRCGIIYNSAATDSNIWWEPDTCCSTPPPPRPDVFLVFPTPRPSSQTTHTDTDTHSSSHPTSCHLSYHRSHIIISYLY